MVEAGLRSVPTTVHYISPHNEWWEIPQSAPPGRQLLQRKAPWLFSQQKHYSPTYLTLKLRNGSQGFYSNNWETEPAPDRVVTTTEQRGYLTQYSGQALVTTTKITPPIKGEIDSTH